MCVAVITLSHIDTHLYPAAVGGKCNDILKLNYVELSAAISRHRSDHH